MAAAFGALIRVNELAVDRDGTRYMVIKFDNGTWAHSTTATVRGKDDVVAELPLPDLAPSGPPRRGRAPVCPQCWAGRLRVRPGTKSTTPVPLWQCTNCRDAGQDTFEWNNASLSHVEYREPPNRAPEWPAWADLTRPEPPPKPMPPDEFRDRMAAIFKNGKPEEDHGDADNLLCEVLRSLGYGDGVREFESGHKWYS